MVFARKSIKTMDLVHVEDSIGDDPSIFCLAMGGGVSAGRTMVFFVGKSGIFGTSGGAQCRTRLLQAFLCRKLEGPVTAASRIFMIIHGSTCINMCRYWLSTGVTYSNLLNNQLPKGRSMNIYDIQVSLSQNRIPPIPSTGESSSSLHFPTQESE